MPVVTRADLELALGELRAQLGDPASGIHELDSPAWTVNRELLVFLGGGRAALLQLAHPYVAQAIDHHSHTRDDVIGRFERTFTNIFAMVCGSLDQAFAAARRVHNIHTRITGQLEHDVGVFRRGHGYAANDLDALIWVHATLVATALDVFERLVRPLTPGERDRYHEESARFAALFGIRRAQLPADWAGFEAYFANMLGSGAIAVGPPARDMGRFLLSPPRPALAAPWRWLEVMTAGLMPPALRAPFGLAFGRAERLAFAASIRALRLGRRIAPPALAHLPRHVAVERRHRGLPPSRTSRAFAALLGRTLGVDHSLLA